MSASLYFFEMACLKKQNPNENGRNTKKQRHVAPSPPSIQHLDMDNLEGSRVWLTLRDGTHTTNVVTTADHHQIAQLQFHIVHNLVRGVTNANNQE